MHVTLSVKVLNISGKRRKNERKSVATTEAGRWQEVNWGYWWQKLDTGQKDWHWDTVYMKLNHEYIHNCNSWSLNNNLKKLSGCQIYMAELEHLPYMWPIQI